MGVIFMPKREYGIKLCAAGDTDGNGSVTGVTLQNGKETINMAEINQNQGQQTQQAAGTAQAQTPTAQQNQSNQQGAAPAIDYGKIQQMLDGTLAAKEDTALKAYFKQQGLSQQEVEQAIAAFKQQKAPILQMWEPCRPS